MKSRVIRFGIQKVDQKGKKERILLKYLKWLKKNNPTIARANTINWISDI